MFILLFVISLAISIAVYVIYKLKIKSEKGEIDYYVHKDDYFNVYC